jgi:hypothetical protein
LVLPLHRQIQCRVDPPQLAVEVGDLVAQPGHVAARRQIDQVPDAPALALEVAPGARLRASGESERIQERAAAHRLLQAGADGALSGVEGLPEQRLP